MALYAPLDIKNAKELTGSVAWRSPSNIALVKYWGKFGRQYPSNPSVSFTLDNAHTNMVMNYLPGNGTVRLFFEKTRNESFEKRIKKFFDSVTDIYPFLSGLDIEIHSDNSFPHSAGIASSASAMSALAMCLVNMERNMFGGLEDKSAFLAKASYLARLASGSAARECLSEVSAMGEHATTKDANNDTAIDVSDKVHPMFHTFKNSILIASAKEKSVSSSAGHQLMENNAYAPVRFKQANDNLTRLMDAMKDGNMDTFIEIVEQEALTLHALMMTSTPSYVLMKPASLVMIEKIRAYRAETGHPLCFTLDAGPNIHLLYPASIADPVQAFIQSELKQHCENGLIIEDQVGMGASELSVEKNA